MAQPFFNTNYRVASTAPAAALIAQTGQTQGQMFANMGKQIGGMIEQYGLNKQKRDESEAAFQGKFGRISEQPGGAEKILAMQNDPVIGPTLKRIQDGKGTQKDFDKFNAFTSADTEQEIQLMRRRAMESDIATKLLENENRELRNEIGQRTKEDVIEGIKADRRTKESTASMTETDESYYKEDKALARRDREGLIDYRKNMGLAQLIKSLQQSNPTFAEQFTPLAGLQDKLRGLNVKTPKGESVTFAEYEKFHNDEPKLYPMVGEPGAIKAQLDSVNLQIYNLTREQPVQVNLPEEKEPLEKQEQPPVPAYKAAIQRIEEEKQRKYMDTPGVGGMGFPFMP